MANAALKDDNDGAHINARLFLTPHEVKNVEQGGQVTLVTLCSQQDGEIQCSQVSDPGKFPVDQQVSHMTPQEILSSAMAAALDRGRGRVADILAGPEMLSSDKFAQRLGTTRMTVNAWVKDGGVLALEGPRRGQRFPTWQIDRNSKIVAGLSDVLAIFQGDSWAAFRFLVSNPDAHESVPMWQLLQDGRHTEVVAAAVNHYEGGYE